MCHFRSVSRAVRKSSGDEVFVVNDNLFFFHKARPVIFEATVDTLQGVVRFFVILTQRFIIELELKSHLGLLPTRGLHDIHQA